MYRVGRGTPNRGADRCLRTFVHSYKEAVLPTFVASFGSFQKLRSTREPDKIFSTNKKQSLAWQQTRKTDDPARKPSQEKKEKKRPNVPNATVPMLPRASDEYFGVLEDKQRGQVL